MKTIIIFILLLIANATNYSQGYAFNEKYIDSTITSFKQKWDIPGISVAIAKDGRLIYAKGFGYADTSKKEPVTTNSLFRIASCSKTITALGIMKLVENNKLHLDDTVFGEKGILNDTLYRNIFDKRVYDITVRSLLNQTIGWPQIDIVGENYASYALHTSIPSEASDNIKYILQQELEFSPSTGYRYSDFNYLILGEIISKVSKRNHEEFILSEILHPIGVNTTIPGKSTLEERMPNEVIYYDYNGELSPSVFDTTKMVPISYSYYMKPMLSSGGWISRPIDMVKIILSIDGLNNPPDILKKETIDLMTTVPQKIKSHYAMGMDIVNSSWFHTGAETWGTSALWYKTENNVCFAITCNTLPSTKGTEEEKTEVMIKYMRELQGFFYKSLKKITSYPNNNLFENPK